MARVLVTGMSGTGKSTLLSGLARRGHMTVDTDYDGWVLADGRWDEVRMDAFLVATPDVVVSGTVENQGQYYDRFDHVVLLSAPFEVLLERVSARTTNRYGTRPEDVAEIVFYVETVEPLLRAGATVTLDATADPEDLVDAVESLLARTSTVA